MYESDESNESYESNDSIQSNSDLDQHFLIDKGIAKKIVDALEVKPEDVVLEIGPGKGALTQEIPACRRVIAVEIDSRLILELKQLENEFVKIVHGNGLEKIREIRFTKLLTNTPYAIIEPLFQRMFYRDFDLAVVVVGSGTAQHLKEDNLLALITNSFFDIEDIGIIPRLAFFPVPKTESTILRMKKKINPTESDLFVQNIYKQNDKVLKNALREFFVGKDNVTKKQAKEKIDSMKLDEDLLKKIVLKLTLEEWKLLINLLNN